MKGTQGRNIFIIDLKKVLGAASPAALAQRSKDARLSGVWIRVARGQKADPNMSLAALPAVRQALADAGVELWGWHVPFCATPAAAAAEASKVLGLAKHAGLAGLVIDAERTDESPRFQGGPAEAEIYSSAVVAGLKQEGRGVAFSSHDQPALHPGLPFKVFLSHVPDICPQVYYKTEDPSVRLGKSVHDYKKLVPPADFTRRYRPTGNITITGDIPFPDVATCLKATAAFLKLVKTAGYPSHSFWCWDTAPHEVWDLFKQTPV